MYTSLIESYPEFWILIPTKFGSRSKNTQLLGKVKWMARRWVFRAPCAPGPFYTVPEAAPTRSTKVCMSFVSSRRMPLTFMRIYRYIYIYHMYTCVYIYMYIHVS